MVTFPIKLEKHLSADHDRKSLASTKTGGRGEIHSRHILASTKTGGNSLIYNPSTKWEEWLTHQNAPQLKREAYLPHRKPNSKKVPPTSLTSIKVGNTEAKRQENRTTRSWREELLTERINWGKANSLLDPNRNATPTCKKRHDGFFL